MHITWNYQKLNQPASSHLCWFLYEVARLNRHPLYTLYLPHFLPISLSTTYTAFFRLSSSSAYKPSNPWKMPITRRLLASLRLTVFDEACSVDLRRSRRSRMTKSRFNCCSSSKLSAAPSILLMQSASSMTASSGTMCFLECSALSW